MNHVISWSFEHILASWVAYIEVPGATFEFVLFDGSVVSVETTLRVEHIQATGETRFSATDDVEPYGSTVGDFELQASEVFDSLNLDLTPPDSWAELTAEDHAILSAKADADRLAIESDSDAVAA